MKKTNILFVLLLFSVYCPAQYTDAQVVQASEKEAHALAPIQKKELAKKNQLNDLMDKAVLGDAQAMYEVGQSYEYGELCKTDQKKAFQWYSDAAKAGSGPAWSKLGVFYKYGIVEPLDYVRSYECFCEAARRNDLRGIYSKGYLEYKGIGCSQDYEAACRGFKKGATDGDLGSMYLLGVCYRNGYGVRLDADSASYWLKKASGLGYYAAQYELEAKTPEYYPNTSALLQKVEAAKKIGKKIDYALNQFTKIENKVSANEINGAFDGYLLQYDWSKTKVTVATPLSLNLKMEGNLITGDWTEEGLVDGKLPINAILDGQNIVFKEMKYQRSDHYHREKPLVYEYQSAAVQLLRQGDEVFMAGDLSLYVTRMQEPYYPMTLILTRKPTIGAETLIVADNGISDLKAYPNPFYALLNVEFSVGRAGNVGISIHSTEGKLIYDKPSTYLERGNYVIQLLPDVPAGVYLVNVCMESGKNQVFKIEKF